MDFVGHSHDTIGLSDHLPFGMDSGPGSEAGNSQSTSPAIRRRAPIACRRCRRMRSKCVHDKATPPCKACGEAGLEADDCIFPVRGQPDSDRQYRHPRIRSTKTSIKRDTAKARRRLVDSGVDDATSSPNEDWDTLPPLAEIIDAVSRFTRHSLQLGFIPKQQFLDKLRRNPQSVDYFLLLSILSVSARLSPALAERFGTGVAAAEFFMERAASMAIGEIYQEPTLERCQAFYLLSISQQGNGLTSKSHINMGIAMRLATLMQLHREETYHVPRPPVPDAIIRAESARRTLWLLYSQDSIHSGPFYPVSLAASDITALLPSDEADFDAGRLPRFRAALADTLPALKDPALVHHSNRSLFASFVQVHYFWGTISRRAINHSRSPRSWNPGSQSGRMLEMLRDWEASLPVAHRWSPTTLESHKAERQDLGYLGVTMMTRLCNIVARRPYLADIIKMDHKQESEKPHFSSLSSQLFSNVRGLFEQIETQFTNRPVDESVGAQMSAFCVYSCALFSAYLCKYPHICPDAAIAASGQQMFARTQAILVKCKDIWPLASRWIDSLKTFFVDPSDSPSFGESQLADVKRDIFGLGEPGRMPGPPSTPSQSERSHGMASNLSSYSRSTSFSYSQREHPQETPGATAVPHPQHHLPRPRQGSESLSMQLSAYHFPGLVVDTRAGGQHQDPAYFERLRHQQQQRQQQQPPPQQPQTLPPATVVNGHMSAMVDRYGGQHPAVAATAAAAAAAVPPQTHPSSYGMNSAPGPGPNPANTAAFPPVLPAPGSNAGFYPPTTPAALGPRRDGFENELQSYIGGSAWAKHGSWDGY